MIRVEIRVTPVTQWSKQTSNICSVPSGSWYEGQSGDDLTLPLRSQARVLTERVRSHRSRLSLPLVKSFIRRKLPSEGTWVPQYPRTNLLHSCKGRVRMYDIRWRVTVCVQLLRVYQPSGFQECPHERVSTTPQRASKTK